VSPDIALEYINASKSTTYSVADQFHGGENQGAYRLVSGDGTGAVLKLSSNPMWRSQIERAKAATDHLRPLGYPVPKYLYIDSTDQGTFWLEDQLPGDAIVSPTPAQITELLNLVELQKGQAISEVQGQDWSWYVAGVVFRGDGGLVRVLMQFSVETSALAAQIEGLVLGLDSKVLSKSDLVHGDLGISQVLAQGDKISAVLDWDQVGYGDRAMDLVGLWYSLMDLPAARDQVYAKLLQITDHESLKIFAANKMLAMVAWSINKPGGEVATAVQQAKSALQILSTL